MRITYILEKKCQKYALSNLKLRSYFDRKMCPDKKNKGRKYRF